MGFWGSLALCRPGGELGELDAVVSRDESVAEVGRPGGAWRIGQGEDATLIVDAETFLQDLVGESGAPALLGYVVDSDCVDVVAFDGSLPMRCHVGGQRWLYLRRLWPTEAKKITEE